MIRSPSAVAFIRQQRAQQAAQQQQLQTAETLSKAGANASQIDVGGGQNLMQKMLTQ